MVNFVQECPEAYLLQYEIAMHFRHFTKKDVDEKKEQVKPGNFIVTLGGNDWFDTLERIFTMSPWNHSALIVDSDGTIIELLTKGIRKNNLSEYPPEKVHIVDIEMSHEDRQQVVQYAKFMLKKHDTYGWLTIASIAFKIITKSRLVVKLDGTLICSEFVARALSQGGVIWDKDPALITPADLYNMFIAKAYKR